MQSVYVIGPKGGPYKIGKSRDIQRRLAELQTGNHQKLNVFFSIEDEDCSGLEARAHKIFAQNRMNGEWFSASLTEIIAALEAGAPLAPEPEPEEPPEELPKMDGDTFSLWLLEMRQKGLARSDAACARLLGVSANSVVTMKRRGADLRTALACRALLHRLEPYS